MNHITEAVTGTKQKVIVTEVYSRVSGYFRPVNQWNKGKQDEFSQRKTGDVSSIISQLM